MKQIRKDVITVNFNKNEPIKILVCGGRHYDDWDKIDETLDRIRPRSVVHGDATGADSMAAEWCAREGITQYRYPANWALYGKRAGPVRNGLMLDEHPDIKMVVAFPGGKGTEDMVNQAKARNIMIMRIH